MQTVLQTYKILISKNQPNIKIEYFNWEKLEKHFFSAISSPPPNYYANYDDENRVFNKHPGSLLRRKHTSANTVQSKVPLLERYLS